MRTVERDKKVAPIDHLFSVAPLAISHQALVPVERRPPAVSPAPARKSSSEVTTVLAAAEKFRRRRQSLAPIDHSAPPLKLNVAAVLAAVRKFLWRQKRPMPLPIDRAEINRVLAAADHALRPPAQARPVRRWY